MLLVKYFKGKLCDSNLSYEFFPVHPLKLPLLQLGEELEKNGLQLEIKTQYVLVFLTEGNKISLFPSGKILVKNVNVEEDANRVFSLVLKKMNACSSTPSIKPS